MKVRIKVMPGMVIQVMVGGMAKVMEKRWKSNIKSDGTSNGKRDGTSMGGSNVKSSRSNGNVVEMVGVEKSMVEEYANKRTLTEIR